MNNNTAFERQLAARLYRADCPSAVELGEYQLGVLDSARAAFVRQHAPVCPHCKTELAQLNAYLTALAPQLPQSAEVPGLVARMRERVKIFVAELLPGTPQMALRGDDAHGGGEGNGDGDDGGATQMYEADDMQISLSLQEDPDRPDAKLLLGLVLGADGVGSGWQAHVWQANQQVASVPVDEFGNFAAPGLQPGNYQLILSSADAEVHVPVQLNP